MAFFNKCVMMGNLTKDITVRYTETGLAFGYTTLVVNYYFNSNGQKQEEVLFIDLDFFGKSAETAKQFLKKGSNIHVSGRLKLKQWTDNNGYKHTKYSLHVEDMQMIKVKD